MPHFQSLVVLLLVLFSAPKMAADFLKKQELRKAKSEGTKTVINIGSPVCFQEFFGILETVNTQANYTLQSQKHRMTFASMRNCWEVGHNRVL
jgi:hypothetical protein